LFLEGRRVGERGVWRRRWCTKDHTLAPYTDHTLTPYTHTMHSHHTLTPYTHTIHHAPCTHTIHSHHTLAPYTHTIHALTMRVIRITSQE
jgi:hypothetical protein